MDFRKSGFSNRSFQALNESIDTEKEMRIKWKKNYERMRERFPDQNNFAVQFDKLSTEDAMAKDKFVIPTKKLPPPLVTHRINASETNEYLVKLGMQDAKKGNTLNMYKPSEDERRLIYSGVSANMEGRYKYLKERKKTRPDEKYAFPVTASMDYGWLSSRTLLDDQRQDKWTTSKSLNGFPSEYAVRNVIMSNFYRSNGVLSEQTDLNTVKIRGTSKIFDASL